MIKLLKPVENKVYVAASGGCDSMAALSFLSNSPRRTVEVLYFNHSTEYSNIAEEVVERFCGEKKIKLHKGKLTEQKERRDSPEEFWRKQRYKFFDNFKDKPIITAHHLDDVVEWYLFSSFNGNAKLINYQRENIIRPFLLTEKKELYNWCLNHNVPYVEDQSNKDTRYARNRIRHNIIPEVLKINPGIKKNLRKMLLNCENVNVDNPKR
jgi:tRNA(Ile)-lysidine synthase